MQQRRMDRLAVLLDLTPAQRQQVQQIFTNTRAKMRQEMQQERAAHQAIRKDAKQRLASVLSPTQMQKLKLLMPQRHRRFMMRGPMDMRGPMGMRHPDDGTGPPP